MCANIDITEGALQHSKYVQTNLLDLTFICFTKLVNNLEMYCDSDLYAHNLVANN